MTIEELLKQEKAIKFTHGEKRIITPNAIIHQQGGTNYELTLKDKNITIDL